MDAPIPVQQPRSTHAGLKVLLLIVLVVVVAGAVVWYFLKRTHTNGVIEERQQVIEQILKDSAEAPAISPEDKNAIIGEMVGGSNVTPDERQAIIEAMTSGAQ